ncbi:TPA: YtpR family tRNA-binding protein [Streptococcus agalactiae]
MIFTYNREHVGDTLMVIVKDSQGAKLDVDRRGQVAHVYLQDSKETVAWNIFEVSSLIVIEGAGQITLSDQDIKILNAELLKEGFEDSLVNNIEPTFVVAQIKEMIDHPDSDHLHICQAEINDGKTVQIVCGAPNASVGLKTVAALPGAMMPNGSLIFPGKLRGEDSFGMLCSARELALPNAPQVRGIIELSDQVIVGESFDANKHWKN